MPTVIDFNRLRDTLLPELTKPENASVFDPFYRAPIRTIIKALGLDDPQQVMALGTPLEAGQMAGGALEAIGKRFPRFAQALKVYHGSPHDFERFDASKIGTGEGAQAYGHGLYFAENPEVAQTYKDAGVRAVNGPLKWAKEAKGVDPLSARVAQNYIDLTHDPLAAAQRIEADLASTGGGQSEHFVHFRDAANQLKAGNIPAGAGRTYEVAIHADPEHFLDWDKPLSQQSEHVKRVIGPLGQSPQDIREAIKVWEDRAERSTSQSAVDAAYSKADKLKRELAMTENATGAEFYRNLSDTRGSSSGTASDKLRDLGIAGIRYLDQGSRSAGAGSRNYVVFPGNEHLIDILKKYGIAATTGVGIAGGLASQERQ